MSGLRCRFSCFFKNCASAGDYNDPGEGGQEGGSGVWVGARWGGGQRGGGDGQGATGRERQGWGSGEGETGMGKRGGVEVLARAGVLRGRRGEAIWKGTGAMGRGRWGGGNGKGETVKGQMGGGEEGARGEEISQMDMMKCLGGHMECLGGMRLKVF